MATVTCQLDPASAAPPAATFGRIRKIDGTNFSFYNILLARDERVFFAFRAARYGSGNLSFDVEWYADTATSGDVVLGVAVGVITPNTDTQDIETKALATENTVTDTHLGTTGQRLHRATVTVSNLDSLAADDIVFVRLRRGTAGNGDTLTGDILIPMVAVSYSDT